MNKKTKSLNIGFISTRLAGTDGVSLETAKWAQVLQEEGHKCFFMAGELDTPENKSFLSHECHFTHPIIKDVSTKLFSNNTRTTETTLIIEKTKHSIKLAIKEFIAKYQLDLIIPENALAIPMNIPLGLAISETAIETGISMIAHHHDFFWERKRFLSNACWDYLNQSFPPNLPSIQHVVINSSQDNQLSLRTGISPTIIPNVMDFSDPAPVPDGYTDTLRSSLNIEKDELFILQPTRIVQRKGIEHAIEFVHRLNRPAKLVISHASGDEGNEYYERVIEYSNLLNVNTVLCNEMIADERKTNKNGDKIYTLGDLYQECDMVTYPSTIEGFGNAFLEAIYYHCPIMVNNYSIYNMDIRPKGFKTIMMDDYISENTIETALELLDNPEMAEDWARTNYKLASQYFSHEVLRQKLNILIMNAFGA